MKYCFLAMLFALTALAADVTGKWNVTAVTGGEREIKLEMTLSGESGNLKGTLASDAGAVDLQDVKLAGDQLSFKFSAGDASYQVKFAVDGDSMKGSYSSDQGASGKVSAIRAH